MTQTMRVSLPGHDALFESDIYNYSIYADSDNILIKENARGSGDTDDTVNIDHSLGYIPFYLLYTEISPGRYRVNSFFDVAGGTWRCNAGTTFLNIINGIGSSAGYRYYIFYDQMT